MLVALKNDATIQNPVLDLLPPNRAHAVATVYVKFLGASVALRPSVQMHFAVVSNRATVTVDSVDLSGFNVPLNAIQADIDRIKKVAEDQINEDIQNATRGTKLKLTNLAATDDSLVIDFSE